MAQKLEPEVIEILDHIRNGKNFLLSGGAGSGKTYSLVQVIRETIKTYPTKQIACITYTNAAVKEIKDRISSPSLHVSTIHEFLWQTVEKFQKELKSTILDLINEGRIINPSEDEFEPYDNEFINGISYKEHVQIDKGYISHDEVIKISRYMFGKYKILSDILKSKYNFIYIDEYQDTNPDVISLLLECTTQSIKPCIFGFFGDSMQAIYDTGIGNLDQYITSRNIIEVQQTQNRRNPQSIIDLANKLRTDGLIQVPSNDSQAPNMKGGVIKHGKVCFVYSSAGEQDNEAIRNSEHCREWDRESPGKTKELNLTQNLIANKAGYKELMDIYDKDPIIDLKTSIVNRLKKGEYQQVTDDMTLDVVADTVPVFNIKKQPKKNIILENPQLKIHYDFLKDRPFSEVSKIYLDKDSLLDDKKDDPQDMNKTDSKRDAVIKQLFKIQELILLYGDNKYNEFTRKTNFKISSGRDKENIKRIIDQLSEAYDSTIMEVIDFAHNEGLCIKDDTFNIFIRKNDYLYHRVGSVSFSCFQKLHAYLEGYTPFSTQHKVKGSEYENVLVILDNGGWNNKYNFKALLGERTSSEAVIASTKKLFYVCCTRAMDNLVVYFHKPSQNIINSAKVMFGENNVFEIKLQEIGQS